MAFDEYINLTPQCQLRLYDDGNVIYVLMRVPASQYNENYGEVVSEQLPFATTVNGVRSSWQAYRLTIGPWHQLAAVYVSSSQTFTFHLGDANSAIVGPAVDFSRYLARADVLSIARIWVNGGIKKGIVYVNVAGVWKVTEAYAKYAGEWKQTT